MERRDAGSHLQAEKPSDEYFYANAERVEASDVLIFDGNMWHAAVPINPHPIVVSLPPSTPNHFLKSDYPRALV